MKNTLKSLLLGSALAFATITVDAAGLLDKVDVVDKMKSSSEKHYVAAKAIQEDAKNILDGLNSYKAVGDRAIGKIKKDLTFPALIAEYDKLSGFQSAKSLYAPVKSLKSAYDIMKSVADYTKYTHKEIDDFIADVTKLSAAKLPSFYDKKTEFAKIKGNLKAIDDIVKGAHKDHSNYDKDEKALLDVQIKLGIQKDFVLKNFDIVTFVNDLKKDHAAELKKAKDEGSIKRSLMDPKYHGDFDTLAKNLDYKDANALEKDLTSKNFSNFIDATNILIAKKEGDAEDNVVSALDLSSLKAEDFKNIMAKKDKLVLASSVKSSGSGGSAPSALTEGQKEVLKMILDENAKATLSVGTLQKILKKK